MRIFTALLWTLILVACAEAPPSTITEGGMAGTWELRVTATGEVFQFEVSADTIEYSDEKYFAALGLVAALDLRGFLLMDSHVMWLEEGPGGTLDEEVSLILRKENDEYVLGGDRETTEMARLCK